MGLAVALVQLRCSEDPGENLDQALARVDEAARDGARILYYPTAIGWQFDEGADVDLGLVEKARREWPFLRDRRIDAYGDLEKRFRD